MRKFNIIDPLYMSFYSKEIYQDVARSWSTRLCMLYLLSLTAICWIPGIIRLDTDVTYYIDNIVPKYVVQMPAIEISKGEASIKEKQPYLINDPDSGKTAIIIDTTGATKSLDNSTAFLLLTKDRLTLKKDDKERTVLEMRDLGDVTITRTMAFEWLEAYTEWFGIMVYPFAVMLSYVFRIVQILLLALVGAVASKIFKVGIDYRLLIRIFAVAVTPLLVFDALTGFFRIEVPMPLVADLLITTGYLIFAIKSSSTASPS